MKNRFRPRFHGIKASLGKLEIELARKPGNGHGYIAIRPEDIVISKEAFPSQIQNGFRGRVIGVVDRGFMYEVHLMAQRMRFLKP